MPKILISLVVLSFSITTLAMIGGTPVLPSDDLAKSLVGVYNRVSGESKGKYCSGTLVSARVVLTAAHCFGDLNSSKTVVAFSNEPMRAIHENNPDLVRRVFKVLPHPDYLKATSKFEQKVSDVALVFLDQDPPTWARVMQVVPPYSLPVFPDKVLAVASGTEFTSINSLFTVLKKAEFFILKNVDGYLAQMKLVVHPADPLLGLLENATNTSNRLFLTQEVDDYKTAPGDSGSPAIINKYGIPSVMGVLSGPLEVNGKDFATYYVNLHEPSINRWIRNNY